jgi:GNAT superfamily N-acetyltransferase
MICIRQGRIADREAVRRIAAVGMREFGVEPEFDTLDLAVASIGAPGTDAIELVADDDGVVCGSIVVLATGKLEGFYIDPDWRGRGIGKMLLAAATDAARAAGLRRLTLYTLARMLTAVALYESLGWCRVADPGAESGADRAYSLTL